MTTNDTMGGEKKVDLLDIMRDDAGDAFIHRRDIDADRGKSRREESLEAIALVRSLIEAAVLVNGDHAAPHDCYATGPLTGDAYLDLIRCPGCQLAGVLARIGGTP